MPNWCSNSIAFITEDDKSSLELERLRNKLIEIKQMQDGGYLFTILKEHGIDDDSISCRGEVHEIGEIQTTFVGKMHCFIIGAETAWGPTPEMWDVILEKYEGIFTVYTAEEPGMAIYINTDDQGYCFTDRYRFECYLDNNEVLNRTNIFGIGKSFSNKNGDFCEYFDSDTDIVDFFSEFIGRKFFSLTHIKDFCESIYIVTGGEINFSLNEFCME